MKKFKLLACSLLVLAFIAGCSKGQKGEVLVNVNGHEVTAGDLDFLGTINPRIKTQITNAQGRKKILDSIVEQELFYQEAVKKGVNRKPDVKDKVDLYRRVIIAQSLLEDEINKKTKKYYEEHPEEFKKLKFSHIMVKYASLDDIKKAKKTKGKKLHSEKEALKMANEIKARLDKGDDFVIVARETSEDLITKNRGGDLGLASKDEKRLEARGYGPLLEKAYTMKVGEITGPIKTNQGYHIVTVTKGVELEPYEQAQRSILFNIRSGVRADLLKRLKDNAKIVYAKEEKEEMTAKMPPPKIELKVKEKPETKATEKPIKTKKEPAKKK